MREHLPKIAGIAAGALLLGLLFGAGLGRADAGSGKRYGEVAEGSQAAQLQQRLAEVTAERDRLRQENEQLAESLRGAAPAVDLGNALTRLNEEAANLRKELEFARDEARAALTRVNGELTKAKAQLESAQKAAERQATEARAEVARWRQEATDARGQVDGLRREIATLNDTIKTLKMFERR